MRKLIQFRLIGLNQLLQLRLKRCSSLPLQKTRPSSHLDSRWRFPFRLLHPCLLSLRLNNLLQLSQLKAALASCSNLCNLNPNLFSKKKTNKVKINKVFRTKYLNWTSETNSFKHSMKTKSILLNIKSKIKGRKCQIWGMFKMNAKNLSNSWSKKQSTEKPSKCY